MLSSPKHWSSSHWDNHILISAWWCWSGVCCIVCSTTHLETIQVESRLCCIIYSTDWCYRLVFSITLSQIKGCIKPFYQPIFSRMAPPGYLSRGERFELPTYRGEVGSRGERTEADWFTVMTIIHCHDNEISENAACILWYPSIPTLYSHHAVTMSGCTPTQCKTLNKPW